MVARTKDFFSLRNCRVVITYPDSYKNLLKLFISDLASSSLSYKYLLPSQEFYCDFSNIDIYPEEKFKQNTELMNSRQ